MKSRTGKASRGKYESQEETNAAIVRIHGHFEQGKAQMARNKKNASPPEGLLRPTLLAMLKARKSLAAAQHDLDEALKALRRALPESSEKPVSGGPLPSP